MPAPDGTPPRAGDVLLLTRTASVQFVQPIRVRVIRVLDRPTYHGWCWIEAAQLNDAGDATARRELYVQPAGVRYLAAPATQRPAPTPTAAPRQPASRPKISTRTGSHT